MAERRIPMWSQRIAVINDGEKIVPYSRDARVTLYEENDNGLKLIFHTNVKHLIGIEHAGRLIGGFPSSPYDVECWNNMISILVCGKISDGAAHAFYKMKSTVILSDVYGSMDTFVEDYLNDELKSEEREKTDRYTPSDLIDYLDTVWDDWDDISEGCERYGAALNREDKLEVLDHFAEEGKNSGYQWLLFDHCFRAFDINVDYERAVRYAGIAKEKTDRWNTSDVVRQLDLLINHISREDRSGFCAVLHKFFDAYQDDEMNEWLKELSEK